MPIRLLNRNDITALSLPIDDVLALTRLAYRREQQNSVDVPTKIGVHPEHENSFLDAMPAWVGGPDPALGMKWVSYFPGNQSRGKSDSTGLIVLNSPDDGHPVSIMEGMHVTFLRTAACAAVMAEQMVQSAPTSIGLVGCGEVGRWTLRIMRHAFPTIRTVHVASRTPSSRERFCQELSHEADWQLTPARSVSEAVSQSDIVISSIPPTDSPPILLEDFRDGSLFIPLDLTHSWDDAVLTHASQVVADNPQFLGKMLRRHRPHLDASSIPITPLIDILGGRPHAASSSPLRIAAVCGIASPDVLLGWEIYRRACAADIGVLYEFLPTTPTHARASEAPAQLLGR